MHTKTNSAQDKVITMINNTWTKTEMQRCLKPRIAILTARMARQSRSALYTALTLESMRLSWHLVRKDQLPRMWMNIAKLMVQVAFSRSLALIGQVM